EKLEDQKVRCNLCQHRCLVASGKRGICGVRENRGGVLESLVYAKLVAKNVDPIEKKPLFHVLPGSLSYSIATVGCNFSCQFCQNANIAQLPKDFNGRIAGEHFPPEKVVQEAVISGSKTIAYTYTEPTVFFEYALDTAKLAKQKGLRNVFVTNGYATAEAIELVGPYLDAANVDLKAFNKPFYKEMVGAKLEKVLETIKCLSQAGVFLEITTLLIPQANDDPKELAELASWIVENLGPQTPWHVSRFHPTYKLMDRGPTPLQSLLNARQIGKDADLYHVYTGNIPGQGGEETLCHNCGALLIDRVGYRILTNNLAEGGACPSCNTQAAGIWE
ncbi:MAG: AmmeMemoRadiSam system radical SAM enzyme, partial [Desulfatibacillaceae bacterium]|nr:AmmeMemoRadiSam system radical SAM enzyme [Desulfatibacillaceae bacterium]